MNAATADVVRPAPPLILDEADADTFLARLPGVLGASGAAAPVGSRAKKPPERPT